MDGNAEQKKNAMGTKVEATTIRHIRKTLENMTSCLNKKKKNEGNASEIKRRANS